MRVAVVRRERTIVGSRPCGALLLAGAMAIGAMPHASGQSILQEWQGLPGATGGSLFGNCLDLLPDVDGDGVLDLVVGSPHEQPATKRQYDGAVYVMSGRTAAVIRVHYGSAHAQLGTDVAALDDVDGDGVADYAAIDGSLGKRDVVIAWSGASGAQLWQAAADPVISEAFDGKLSLLPDLDGDGRSDIGVAASRGGSNPGTSLTVLSAATGASIVDWKPTFALGRVMSACRLDDLTGDGVEEFAVGHDYLSGRVEIVDGATLAITASLSTAAGGVSTFGDHCGQVGDFDGDGIRDVIVSDQMYGSSPPDGRVYVFSSATFSELFHLDHPQKGALYGYGVVAERSDFDFNGDGFPDVAIGRVGPLPYWQSPPTGIDVWSGRTGRLLCFIPSVTLGDEGLGCAMQFMDWNGDGFDDLVGGAFWNDTPPMSTGMVHVFAGNDLFLQLSQPAYFKYRAGDSIEAATRGGEPNEWTLLALVDVDGTPTFDTLNVVQLDAFGESLLSDTVPSGLAGTTVTLRAYATHPTRSKLAVSDDVVVQFQ